VIWLCFTVVRLARWIWELNNFSLVTSSQSSLVYSKLHVPTTDLGRLAMRLDISETGEIDTVVD
jgi:hypothetical protein